jgi:hypothetical protein
MMETETATLTTIPEIDLREQDAVQVPSPSTTGTEAPQDFIPITATHQYFLLKTYFIDFSMSSLNQLAKRIQNPRKQLHVPKPLFSQRQSARIGAVLNDLTNCSVTEYIHLRLNTSQITLPESLLSYGLDDTFPV